MEGPRENLAGISAPASDVEHGRLRGGCSPNSRPRRGHSLDTDHILLGGGTAGPMSGPKGVSAFAWRSLCQMSLCLVGVELGLLREKGASGTVHLHRYLVERAGRRVMRKADPRNVL